MRMNADRVFIIAEAGVNHNGDLRLAMQLVDAAADCGADAVKFQTFTADAVVTSSAEKADYQKSTTGAAESQHEMIRKLELPRDWHHRLKEHSEKAGIEFMSTPFDADSADFLVSQVGVRRLKVPSGEITNGPFLLHIARLGLPVIVSTGMSTLAEVRSALAILAHGFLGRAGAPDGGTMDSDEGRAALRRNVTLLQCTTEYPAPAGDINLRAMTTLAETFGLPAGLSDHSVGTAVPIAAAALSAAIVEKHITLDRTMPGPDHAASLEIPELRSMVTAIRAVEQALGSAEKKPAACEIKNIDVARRSLVAARAIRKGEAFTEQNLAAKRPGGGVSPMKFWTVVGRAAQRDYAKDEAISLS